MGELLAAAKRRPITVYISGYEEVIGFSKGVPGDKSYRGDGKGTHAQRVVNGALQPP
jgi:hypothetical protein